MKENQEKLVVFLQQNKCSYVEPIVYWFQDICIGFEMI